MLYKRDTVESYPFKYFAATTERDFNGVPRRAEPEHWPAFALRKHGIASAELVQFQFAEN